MKLATSLSHLVIAAAVGAALCSRPAASQDNQPAAGQDAIHRLLVERRDTLREIVDILRANHQKGYSAMEDVIPAQNELLDAELELAATPQERLALHEQRVENLKSLEKSLTARMKRGYVGPKEVLAAKAERLAAEIALHRAQGESD